MVAGILNLDKPKGWTSHDVVAAVRRLIGVRKVGHAGTLDPLATGVLLICVGHAVRLSEFLQGHDKTYQVTIRLGVSTDTYDADGRVTRVRPVPSLSVEEIARVATRFTGEMAQEPPVYSAIKQKGVPLYRRARRGEEVRVTARTVRIDRIEVLQWQSPFLVLRVACSAGTYMRSLAHDLGERLDCGGHLHALARLSSGPFVLADACSWPIFEEAVKQGWWEALLYPLQVALSDCLPVPVTDEKCRQLAFGQTIAGPEATDGQQGYALSADGRVVALLRYDQARRVWQPHKVFLHE